MIRIRRTLGIVATLWLCCQASSMTLSAAIIGMLPFADAMMPCTCVHAAGDSAMCPMHHHQMPAAPAAPPAPAPAPPVAAVPAHEHHAHAAHPGHASGAGTDCHSALAAPQTAPAKQTAARQTAARQAATPQATDHQAATQPPASGPTCHMRSGDTASGAAMVSVFGPLGLLAPPAVSLSVAIVNSPGLPTRAAAIERMVPPDPPPPRA